MAGIDKKETDSLRRLAVPFNPISVTSCPSQSSHPASSSQSRTQASQPANPSQTAAWDFSLASSSGSSKTTWNHVPSLPASSFPPSPPSIYCPPPASLLPPQRDSCPPSLPLSLLPPHFPLHSPQGVCQGLSSMKETSRRRPNKIPNFTRFQPNPHIPYDQ